MQGDRALRPKPNPWLAMAIVCVSDGEKKLVGSFSALVASNAGIDLFTIEMFVLHCNQSKGFFSSSSESLKFLF